MIFGISIVNAYLIYKENDYTSRMTMLQFRESLVRVLLLGVPFENLEGEFSKIIPSYTYDDRFEWDLIHSSSGKFEINISGLGQYLKSNR